ncbi:WSC domain-containing protein-like protein 5 [Apiospora arundinis]
MRKSKLADYWWITTDSILESPTASPSPVQTGVATNCERWIMANAGDTCEAIMFRSNRVSNVLYDNNLILGPKGKYCDTQLLAGYWYCVGTPTITATTTGAPLTVAQTQPTAAAVGAVQKGPASASVTAAPTTTNGAKSPAASVTAASSSFLSPPTIPTAAKPATTMTSSAVTSATSAPPLTLRSSILPTTSTTAKPSGSPAPASTSSPPSSSSSPTAAATSAAAGAGGGGTAVAAPEGATYLGCASEVPGRALNQLATAGADMTIEKCLGFCADARLPLAGLEYGSECFCGTTLAPPSALGNPEACRMPCAGNKSQVCGGPSLLSVFKNGSVAAAPPPVEAATPQKVGGAAGFSYQGCYDEGKGRVLPDAMMGNDTLTGYGLAGVEYGRECWCGKSLQQGAVKLDEGRCGMRCKGEGSQLCGGSGAIGVYEKNGNGGGGGGGGKAKKRDENQEDEEEDEDEEEETMVLEERDEIDSNDGENETDENDVEEERPQTAVKTIRLVRRGRWGGRRHA